MTDNATRNTTAQEIIEATAAQLWQSITIEQLAQIEEAESTGNLEAAFRPILEELAQEAQEGTKLEYFAALSGIPAKADPNSPEFNFDEYREAIGGEQGFAQLWAKTKGTASSLTEPLRGALAGIISQNEKFMDAARTALTSITAFLQSESYKAIKANLQALTGYIEEHKDDFAATIQAGEEIKELAPFIKLVIEEAKENPEFKNLSLPEILEQGIDEDGNPTDSKFGQIIKQARQKRADYEAAEGTIEDIEQAAEELPRIIAIPTDKIIYPLDKPNSIIWALAEDAAATPNGQIKLAIDTSKKGSKQDAVIYYSLNFDELPAEVKLTKNLTQYDKRAYTAAHALYNAGNKTVTASQIYRQMGNSTAPNAKDLQKLNDSLTKMGAGRLYIDNEKEAQQQKNRTHFRYDGPLLPFERIEAYINGKLTDSAIHLFREPPLISFAKERDQVTTMPLQLLESPVNKTEANLRIDDYLLERIAHMKGKKKTPRRMLYETIFKNCGITTSKQKQRAHETIRRYLDHYKKTDQPGGGTWIKGYKEDADGVTIII